MPLDRTEAQQALAHARAALAAAYDLAATTIDRVGVDDPHAAFQLASEYQESLARLHAQQAAGVSWLRARQAKRLREREALSLAGLADRIGVSKARADQLVQLAKQHQQEGVSA